MKLSVIAASALITIAAFGDDLTSVETSNTFGVMKVSCSAQYLCHFSSILEC